VALINLQTNKPKLNVSNIRSPFGGGASIPKISAGAGSLFQNPGVRVKPGKVLNIDEGQLSFNVGLADDIANLRKDIAVNRSNIGDHEKRISMLSGGVATLNEELSEITAIIKDIGDALSLDFANRITEQQQDNRALRAQISANRRSLAESSLEGVKKIGKGIGSGLTGLASKTGSALGLDKILEVGKLLAAGIAINAIIPNLETLWGFITKNLDKILIVGGAIATLNILGGLGFLFKIAKFLGKGKFALIAASLFIQDQLLTKPASKYSENLRKEAAAAGFTKDAIDPLTGKPYKNPANAYIRHLQDTGQTDKLVDLSNMKMHDGGIVTGSTNEVPAILERGEAVIPKELVATLSQKPGVNLIEMNLPDIRVPSNKAAKKVALPETTQVPYASSVNLANKHMTKTPEIHGIIG